MVKFRKLRSNEIDVRTGSVKKDGSGASLLLYKDARCDMNILDETVGAMYWERSHSRDNANCTVSIYNEELNIWVSKEDTGTESYTEKEKGIASDSFKRACFNWGIGRELYTAPFIWVKQKDVGDLKYAKYKCDSIGYDDYGNINQLTISSNGKTVFNFGYKKNVGKDNKTNKEVIKKVDNSNVQKAITSLFNDLVSEFGSNDVVYDNIGVDRATFVDLYKNDPDKLWETLQQYA